MDGLVFSSGSTSKSEIFLKFSNVSELVKLMVSISLHPALTLADIFGAESIMSPRPSPNAETWLPQDAAALDLLTGGTMAVLGDMPVLCSASVSTPEGMRLLHDAGFRLPETIHRFRGSSDYLQVLSELTGRGHTIVVQHVHPEADLAETSCWIHPAILSFLNNKKNLEHLVDASHLPNRCIMSTKQLNSSVSASDLPLVFKAATDESTGGVDTMFWSVIAPRSLMQHRPIFRIAGRW